MAHLRHPETKRWGYRNPCTFDPGTRESRRDEEMAWNKMDVEVGKYLRKHGYIEERKLKIQKLNTQLQSS